MSLLLENNPNVDPICSNIYPGEVCITIDGNPDFFLLTLDVVIQVLCTSKHAFVESLFIERPVCVRPFCR